MTKRKEIIKVTYSSDCTLLLSKSKYQFDQETHEEGRLRRISPRDLISATLSLNNYKPFEERTDEGTYHSIQLVNGVVVLRKTPAYIRDFNLGGKITFAYTSIKRLNDVASKLGLPVTREEYLARKEKEKLDLKR